jgi:lambda repressor-like predicted transcriptional regulator
MRLDRYAVGALLGASALLVGGGAALAGNGKGPERCDAMLAKIAEKRGVSVEALKTDLQKNLLERIDAALAAGKISPERAAALKQRVSEGNLCRAGKVQKHRAVRGMMRAAAEFLGLDREELRAQLPGNSLAGLAQKQGKSVDALTAAMVAPAKERLAKAVANGKISQQRADEALEKLEALAGKLAAKVFPAK